MELQEFIARLELVKKLKEAVEEKENRIKEQEKNNGSK